MMIPLPKLSLVVLIGPSGAGKSTFAARHFLATEVLSSDACRGWVADDPNDQTATGDAFDVLHYIAGKRLAAGRLTVIDATNVQPHARRSMIHLARQHHVLPVAIVLDVPAAVCTARNADRPDRQFGPHVIRNQTSQMRRGLRNLKREGFRHIHVLRGPSEIDQVQMSRVPLWNDRREDRGPFDIIGDVHGCGDELEQLLGQLGYEASPVTNPDPGWTPNNYVHPSGRRAFFVGDLVDRGPRNLDVVGIVRNMVAAGSAMVVPGNHDVKLLKHLRGRKVQIRHGMRQTVDELAAIDTTAAPNFHRELADFIDAMVSHYVLDDGKLVIAHAGMKAEYQGRGSGAVRQFALYGETTGEVDEDGFPVRIDWAADYRGDAMVVYGHTPVAEAAWHNRTLCIDTGCVFGGSLTALRYPELEIVRVPATRVHCEPPRPLIAPERQPQHAGDDLLDAADMIGKQMVNTSLRPNITIAAENATAALEVMSRFAVDPKWLIYLPPTMSPCETSNADGYLEHPTEAFAHYRAAGVSTVLCQEKHMGSRAVMVVCRDPAVAVNRFGLPSPAAGEIYTRTGRAFFGDVAMRDAVLDRMRQTLELANFWDDLETDWVCLDTELMPWSSKAKSLLIDQYAAVGAAGRAAVPPAIDALSSAIQTLTPGEAAPADRVLGDLRISRENIQRFTDVYRHYCWPVESIDDLRVAPFHVLATEGRVHTDRDHRWHLSTVASWQQAEPPLLIPTRHLEVDPSDSSSIEAGIRWWTDLTDNGGEGMVVKPTDFIAHQGKNLLQPAIKCRGREYLRIIYGPDYDTPTHLKRLRHRHLGRKRSLALREFALGIEGLHRFVDRQPLRRTHQCAFGVLALESEPVDPRL